MHRAAFAIPTLLLVGSLLGGCPKQDTAAPSASDAGQPASPSSTIDRPRIGSGLSDSGLVRIEVDFNEDGKPEIVNWMSGAALRKKEADLNRDGNMDVTSWFDGSGILEAEEMDGDFDGRIDWVDHYQAGARVRAEADTDFDGRVDVIFSYADGQVVKTERL